MINLFHGIYLSRYHGPVAPKGSDLASLQLIMAEGGEEIAVNNLISSPSAMINCKEARSDPLGATGP